MSDQIRAAILLAIEEFSQQQPHAFVDDQRIAKVLSLDVPTVQVHLDILEDAGLIRSANSMDGYAALLSPQGRLALEQLREQEGDEPAEVGFKV
jgi:DNA-binding MarR family transcriptional regulator